MSNIIELNIAEIDTVVGGVTAQQAAALQANALSHSTATMAHVPSKTVAVSSSSLNISAMLAKLEGIR